MLKYFGKCLVIYAMRLEKSDTSTRWSGLDVDGLQQNDQFCGHYIHGKKQQQEKKKTICKRTIHQ